MLHFAAQHCTAPLLHPPSHDILASCFLRALEDNVDDSGRGAARRRDDAACSIIYADVRVVLRLRTVALPCMSHTGPEQSCTWMNDLDKHEAVSFINHVTTVEKMPFFLYLATTTPHSGFLQGGSGPTPAGACQCVPVRLPLSLAPKDDKPYSRTYVRSFSLSLSILSYALHSPFRSSPPRASLLGYVNDYPVPYPYNTRFSNDTTAGWSDTQRAFAAAVWAQDVMIGAVLDTLESLSIREKTVVFFSGDNGTLTSTNITLGNHLNLVLLG